MDPSKFTGPGSDWARWYAASLPPEVPLRLRLRRWIGRLFARYRKRR